MRYARLISVGRTSMDGRSAGERAAITAEYMAVREEDGIVGRARLQPIETATTVRVADGRTLTTDGPFADAKESLVASRRPAPRTPARWS
jgi:hypothetical protein